jgi:nicotinamidase/pyrazinamidase
MLPGGALYVPGAEKLIPNLDRLVEAARDDRVFLVSSADAHSPEDSELRQWPPHCLKGTPGAEILPECLASDRLVIPNDTMFVLPTDLRGYQQVTLEKNTLDVFDNPHTDALLVRLGPSGSPPFDADPLFIVFGVVTEYCVQCAVEGLLYRGRRIALVSDAIASLDAKKGGQLLDAWQARGVRLITTNQALSLVAPYFARTA